jgi:ribosomal-protein-alanine N-acetyltransferase
MTQVKKFEQLQLLQRCHAAAVLDFEVANRAYFAHFITDRGDEFYQNFCEGYGELLAEQEAGVCVYYVLLDEDGTVVGRFNLYDLVDGTAEVGYRVAEMVAGHGIATSTLRMLCRLAAANHGLRTLKAKTRNESVASQRVLEKAGFISVGPAVVAGRPGMSYELRLIPS